MSKHEEKKEKHTNIGRIAAELRSGAKEEQRLGIELEHLIYDEDYRVIPYEVMCQCLRRLAESENGSCYEEDGHLLGVETAHYALSLEPGCQLEISIEPLSDIARIGEIYDDFRAAADPVFLAEGYALHTEPVLPSVAADTHALDQIGLLPKERYRVMDAHFRTTGSRGREMMRASASAQVSVDFSSEEDALRKLRLLERLTPFLMLLTEQRSGLSTEAFSDPHLLRAQIWQDVDPVRCGYLPESLSDDYSFTGYAAYVYEQDSILIKKDSALIPTGGRTPEQLYGEQPLSAEETDYLLSIYFPHVRLKHYIEYRIADSMPIADVLSYAALIGRMMYEESVWERLEILLAPFQTTDDLHQAECDIMRDGWDAEICGKTALGWITAIYAIVTDGVTDREAVQLRRLLPLCYFEQEYYKNIRQNEKNHAAEDRGIKDYLNRSTAKYHDRVVRTLYVPKLFTVRETELFDRLIRELYGIFDRVIEHYLTDPSYRKLFGFPRELEELILQEPLYPCNIPMARIDLFYNEKTGAYQFCEFNTDGASAMNEDRELNLAFAQSLAYRQFAAKYDCKTCELFDSWVTQALRIYRDARGEKDACPRVAIVDFLENATINEFYIYKDAFEKAGCETVICDMRAIRFDGTHCMTEDGNVIDLIYRRAVTSDILSHMEESAAFLDAYRSGSVCVLGDFRTQIVHNKILYKILHMEQTKSFLSASQRAFVQAHIPLTMSLHELFDGSHEELKERVLDKKDQWIIKPEDSYGSKGVHAGVELQTKEQWQDAVYAAKDQPYVLQEFCTPYRLDNLVFTEDGSFHWVDTSNLTGLFVYNGQFTGIYSRISYEQVISTQYNEMSLPSIIVG